MQNSATAPARPWAAIILSSIAGLTAVGPMAQAHMVTYKGGVAVMSQLMPDNNITEVNYSASSRFAVAARHFEWQPKATVSNPNGDQWQRLTVGQVNALLHRWYGTDWQGNVYAGVGLGSDETLAYQVDVDWEDRKYYLQASHQSLRPKAGDLRDQDFDIQKVKVGVAPYVAEAGSLHTWLLLQYMKSDLMQRQEALSPLIRLFYQTMLIEVGGTFRGDFNLNLMVHF
jgi:hypothetical protein